MASSTTELIKEKLDVVQFLRGYLNLQPAGKNFKTLCPFHKEKTPSFMVSPERQSWHCFGCGLGGDIFGFLMRYENLEFGEALRVLAEKAGVELRRLDPAEYKYTGLLFELQNEAKEFFKKAFTSALPARQYLEKRGLKPETIDEFELGWAPNEPEALSMHFLNVGYAPDDILRAGLAVKNDRGLFLDRFRGRIMFPIHNHFGKVVGFTGRVLPTPQINADGDADRRGYISENQRSNQRESAFATQVAKYMNSPETPIFSKSRLLYGFWKSKNFIRDAGSVFLVEGQTDFLMSWQAGVKNIVATSGTALTPDHLKSLRRLTEEIVLSFDSDAAGSAASERAIDLAEANDFSVKVATFADFKDPAEAVEAGPENLTEAIKAAVPAPQFYFEKYLGDVKEWGSRNATKRIRVVLGKLKAMTSAADRDFWVHNLAEKTGLSENMLREEMENIDLPKADFKSVADAISGAERAQGHSKEYSRRERISENLLRAAFAKSDYGIIEDTVPYLAVGYEKIFAALKKGERKLSDPTLDESLDSVILGAADVSAAEISELKSELVKEHLKEERHRLADDIKRREEAGDEAGRQSAIRELQNINEKLNSLSATALES